MDSSVEQSVEQVVGLFCCLPLLIGVIIATVQQIVSVRNSARRQGIPPEATGWQRVNESVKAWATEDRIKEAKKLERPRYPGNACQLCGSQSHSTSYHAGR